MINKCEYYILRPIVTDRTPLLMNDLTANPDGADFLRLNKIVEKLSTVHLRLAFPVKDPNMLWPFFDSEIYQYYTDS